VLRVENLAVEFRLHERGVLRAVDGVSFEVSPGSTVALVGESGSGKSVISQSILGILPKSAAITRGRILFRDPDCGAGARGVAKPDEIDIAALDRDGRAMRSLRGARISMIFQEPMTSLSPLHTIGNQVSEALLLHRPSTRPEGEELAREMLAKVGFPDSAKAMSTYPFELSGGLRQRAMIAMALVCRPALLIADEPTTALDVTIQAQILKLIKDLQQELGMALLLITHDLVVVANMADEVVVVYQGKLMERGSVEAIFNEPRHPYLLALLKAVPRVGMKKGERLTPVREVESPDRGRLLAGRPTESGAKDEATLLEVKGLTKRYFLRGGGWLGRGAQAVVEAVRDVSFHIERGECLGLVGESGCGKTTIAKSIMRAIEPDEGEIWFDDGEERVRVDRLRRHQLEGYRQKAQYIFQDPFSSLNPRMTIYDIISEPLVIIVGAIGARGWSSSRS